MALLLFAGCQTVENHQTGDRSATVPTSAHLEWPAPSPSTATLEPPAKEILGVLTWCREDLKIATARLWPQSEIPAKDTLLVAIDEEGNPTALLRLTPQQNPRHLGLQIESGKPAPGNYLRQADDPLQIPSPLNL
jgi:hypothetical protein